MAGRLRRQQVFVAGSQLVIACAPRCVDDGLHARQSGAVCAIAASTSSSTGGGTDVTTTGDGTTGSEATSSGGEGSSGTCGCSSSSTSSESGSSTSSGSSSTRSSTGVESSSGSSTGGSLCMDGLANGDESDIDCGGSCTPCENFLRCDDPGDCASMACHLKGLCVPAGCVDGVHDPDTEIYLDCGSSCGPTCGLGFPCIVTEDCYEGTCQDSTTCELEVHCIDASLDEVIESDIDCGQACGATCKGGELCFENADCYSMICDDGGCKSQPSCANNLKDLDETDVDCGGACPGCAPLQMCIIDDDCEGQLPYAGGLC